MIIQYLTLYYLYNRGLKSCGFEETLDYSVLNKVKTLTEL